VIGECDAVPDRTQTIALKVEEELERQLFHLRTLYDVSRELLAAMEVEPILKNFLLMTTGNFGVLNGFLLIQEVPSKEISHMVSVGFRKDRGREIKRKGQEILSRALGNESGNGSFLQESMPLPDSIVCALPLQVDDSCIGLLGLGPKILGQPYSESDKNLLITLANHLTVVLKNARYAEALKEAYAEVSSLNRAKDKVINHLSHELKTPLALLKASLMVLRRKLSKLPEEEWENALNRAERNLQRLMEIHYEVQDIMQGEEFRARGMLRLLLDQCAEQLELLLAEQVGEVPVLKRVRNRIEEIYGSDNAAYETIQLDRFVIHKLERLKPAFEHRHIQISLTSENTPGIYIPKDPLDKLVAGLIRNAVENTPDEGKVMINVEGSENRVSLKVEDTGVGIIEEHQKRIFEGFFPIQDTDAYSSKRPFDFNAGGKGADLLRMKIFSERYNFDLFMKSSRCKALPNAGDVCPGAIGHCPICGTRKDCYDSGGTSFEVCFPVTGEIPDGSYPWPRACKRFKGN
jgi:K+-sensing histidine kinase KdpD